jgi:ketosteroid isomerase-like protein
MTNADPDTDARLEANKAVARRFIEIFNARDYQAMSDLLAEDFLWHVAVIGEGETEFRPRQSKYLREHPVTLPGPLLNKEESLQWFKGMFDRGADPQHYFTMRLVSLTAEDDRVAMEAEGNMGTPGVRPHYHNVYYLLLRVRDGQLTLYKEYQDTLHIFDVFFADSSPGNE